MRLLAAVIIGVAVLGLMVYTNPRMEDYNGFIRQSVMKESQKRGHDSLDQAFGSLMGGIASGVLASQTLRTDYVFFSTYEVRFGKSHVKALGAFKNFVFLEKPEFLNELKERGHRGAPSSP